MFSLDVAILDDPYKWILRLHTYNTENISRNTISKQESIILPLFSDKGSRNVPKRSGLNQWNAAGRPRDKNEVYIPIPSWIHKKYPLFFPEKDEVFTLRLPNNNNLLAKLCQEGRKALMSNPNSDLGKWLLRDVMNLKSNELLTYDKLQILGMDSVEVYRISKKEYKIDFRPIGSYDEFMIKNKVK